MLKEFTFLRKLLACFLFSGLLATYPACGQNTSPAPSPPRTEPQEPKKAAPPIKSKSAYEPEKMQEKLEEPAKKSSRSGRIGGQTIRKGEEQEEP